LDERLAIRPENAGELGEVAEDGRARRQVLEDEVTDEDVRELVVDAVEPLAGDDPEFDSFIRDGLARALEHRRRDVQRHHVVEPLRQRRRHAAGAATDLDAGSASRIRAESVEQPLELQAAPGGIADVGVRVGRERVPRRSHLHSVSVSIRRVIIASCSR